VRIDVIDKGLGISEENQAKLFQAFSQAESSTTRRFGGTGLGLAICKRLVELIGGGIGVTSKLGEGSTFFVELPYVVAEEARAREKPRDLSGLKVLIVGGVPPRVDTLTTYLRYWGAEAVHAADATIGGEVFQNALSSKHPFDSVAIDLNFDQYAQADAVKRIRKIRGDRKAPLIMLQDFQKRGARIESSDVVTVDANPVVRYRFISAVAVAAGRASPEVARDEDALKIVATKAPTIDEARAQGRLILLAEDNLTNQDVIRRQLNLAGYACEITGDGVEALAAMATSEYAMLLTDCHMPEMDGYELTAKIREHENGGRRMPIIAITANALQGEAERCLAAGMDDYLSKPIAMPALHAMLRKWMPAEHHVNQEAGEATATASSSGLPPGGAARPINESAIKQTFGNDDATFREILVDFIEPSETNADAILAAWKARDADEMKFMAHKLKSSARAVGADVLADVCAALESAGKTADWANIDRLAPQIKIHMKDVVDYIRAL
jgi:CheY-like chemotaxis protein/HPt (histidine-containing phosphotransfer) domain-containing protein